MDKYAEPYEALKQILRHAREPEQLDDHPWTRGLIVQETLAGDPVPVPVSPGAQLLRALARLFAQLQPASPPRRGKRLDPRWGEFGLLAALYFTPFNHGTPFPATLLEAWRRIDEAILYLVFGRPAEALCEEEVKRFQLVGDEVDYGSASTLSDWHRKGLQRFAGLILNRERFLARSTGSPSTLLDPPSAEANPAPQARGRGRTRRAKRLFGLAIILLLVTALTLGALKAWRIYQRGSVVYQDVLALQALVTDPVEFGALQQAVPALTGLRGDLADFKEEAEFLLWAGPKLVWLPTYGPDLAASPALMETAQHLLDASLLASEAARPLLKEFNAEGSAHDLASLTALLVQAQPQLQAARAELDRALAARATIEAERLSPRLHDLLVDQLDPVLKLADESLSLALAMPNLLGAGTDGPKTYLLLAQNEDELRPTGGFITSVGNLVLHNGQVISLEFEPVDTEQDDWSRPYPSAPWQLQEYMNSRVLILRDSNWFTDFPTSALWAEYLYAYTHSHSVDGVVAFDQRFLVMLLGELGPLEVEGAPYPLTEANVIEYMRQAKNPPTDAVLTAPWYRKEFISRIAAALLAELNTGPSHDWRGLASVLSQALAERHLLLQFDDPVVAALLVERGWDNAVRAGAGDYLMAADTNIGFNKTSALVEVSLAYAVDLTDLAAPEAHLTVTHRNNATRGVPCIHWNTGYIAGEETYPLNRCYWSYLRVYRPAGVELLEASPHAIPGGQLLLGRGVPARVDELDEELQGVRSYGTLLVVPGGETWHTGFDFALPPAVLSATEVANQWAYRLRVQKQPGTLAIPITLRIHLPPHATLVSVSRDSVVQGQNLLIEADLRTDLALEVVFTAP